MNSRQVLSNSLFLGMCAGILSSLEMDLTAILFAFFSTSLTYYSLRKTGSFLSLSLFEWVLLSGTVGIFLFLKFYSQIVVLSGFLALLFYTSNTSLSLRKNFILKPITISACWMVVASLIPMIQTQGFSFNYLIAQSMPLFLLTLLLSLLYDWRDHLLQLNDTTTLVSLFNQTTFKLVYAFSIPLFFLLMNFSEISFIQLASFIIAAGFSACLLFFSKKLSYWQLTWLIDSSFIIYYLSLKTVPFLN